MTTLSKRRVARELKRKGRATVENGSKHKIYTLAHPDGGKVETYISKGPEQDIDDNLISRMSEQIGVTRREFIDMTNCPLSGLKFRALIGHRRR